MEERLVEMPPHTPPRSSEMGSAPLNLGFVLYPEMGLPLVKIVASKQTLKNPGYHSIPSQLFADEASSPQGDLLALGKLNGCGYLQFYFRLHMDSVLILLSDVRPTVVPGQVQPNLLPSPTPPTPNSMDSIGGRGLTGQDQDTRSWWKEKV